MLMDNMPVPAPLSSSSMAVSNRNTASHAPSASMSFGESDRVLIYTTCYNVLDGVTLTIRKIEREILAANGHVLILTTQSGKPSNTNLDGTHPNRTVLFMDNSIPLTFLDPNVETSYHLGRSLSSSILAKIDEFRPSVVHMTCPDCTALCVIQYAREKEIPLMGTYHSNIVDYMDHYRGLGFLKPLIAGFIRHQYNFYQSLYVPTPFIRDSLLEKYKMDCATDVKIWGRGIDLDQFNPSRRSSIFRQKLGVSPDETLICFVGRLVAEKRPDIFASTIRRLSNENPHLKFRGLVIGCGPYQSQLECIPEITCLGWLDSAELPTVYASCDVFLFPSAVETFGNVTLEAAACGLPLVVEGGCSGHLVDDGVNGYACENGNEEDFYEATLELVRDDVKRRQFSVEARKISQRFEKRTVVKQMLYNYKVVSEEFYGKFGGRHRNRDEAFQNDDSFLLGVLPRPPLFFVLEFVVILFLRVLLFLAASFNWFMGMVQDRLETASRIFPSHVVLPTKQNQAKDQVFQEKAGTQMEESQQCKQLDSQGVPSKAVTKSPGLVVPIPEEESEDATPSRTVGCCLDSEVSCGDRDCALSLTSAFMATVGFMCRNASYYFRSIQDLTLSSPVSSQLSSRREPLGSSGRGRKRKNSIAFGKLPSVLSSSSSFSSSTSDDEDDKDFSIGEDIEMMSTVSLTRGVDELDQRRRKRAGRDGVIVMNV